MATTDQIGSPESATKNPATVTLISSDGERFLISHNAAVVSPTLEKKLEEFEDDDDHHPPAGCATVTIPASCADSKTLALVTAYLNTHAVAPDDERKNFDRELVSGKEFDILRRLLIAADDLKIEGLHEIVGRKMAEIMEKKSVSWIRRTLGIQSDLTPEEEEEMKRKDAWAWDGVELEDD